MPHLILFLFLLPVLYRLFRAIREPDRLKAEEARQAKVYLGDYFGKARKSRVLDSVGEKLLDTTGLKARFFVLPSEVVNAVCLPNGDIFIWNGLLKEVKNKPDELAAILAHELGHLKHEHYLRSIYWSALLQFVFGIFARPLGFWGRSVASTIIKTGFSRFHEWEADAAAVDILKSCDFNPLALAAVLERVPQTKFPGLLKSHPDPKQRATRIKKLCGVSEIEELPDVKDTQLEITRPIEDDGLPDNVIMFPKSRRQ